MLYVLLSICCNVFVAVLLKLARRYFISIPQAVTSNYFVALILTWFFYKPQLYVDNINNYPIIIYAALGLLLPSLFLIIASSIRFTGIVRTDVAQRLSLFIPLAAAFFIFKENISIYKAAGITIGFLAIICSIPWQKSSSNTGKTKNSWIYPLTVFVGMGIVDILFKQVATYKLIPYTTSLFIIFLIAFFISITAVLYLILIKKKCFSIRHVLFGLILGIANFGNILFYLKAHQQIANNPSVVFSTMNIGVIVLGALVGLYVFKEKLSLLNKTGLILAVLSIIIISINY
jgi:drug/metabolite transporter (DMT)-like permease